MPMRDDQVACTESAGDGRKDDALLEVELSAGCVEQRAYVGIRWPQRGFDVVDREGVVVERLADEVIDAPLLFDQERHCRMERDAPLGIA